jgi:SNF2 family DNA or RNA helicase
MIVDENKRELILNLREPKRILDVVPNARLWTYQGHPLIVVPHRTPEVKLLNNLGFSPPHPVDHYYDWPARFAPMDAQRATVRFLTTHNRAYCLNDLGTGKTLSALWAFDYLKKEGLAKRMLVVAPLSTLERTWADEVFKHFPHLTATVLHASVKATRLARLEHPADLYIINHDGVKVMLAQLLARVDIDTLVIDELSQVARNAGTDRWKALQKLVQRRDRVWGMTGTPVPNEPTDAWAQCRLITPSSVPGFFSHWRLQTMTQVNQYKWVPKPDALTTVERAMQPAIRFRRDECVDLPPMMHEVREVALTPAQKRLYTDMQNTYYAQYRGGEITAVNAAVKAMRLVQIASGAAYDVGHKPVVILPKPRVEAVLEVIDEAPSKVIVFVPYKASLHMLAAELGKHTTVEVISGEVSKTKRDRIFSAFQQATDPKVIVAQPAAMSHGLTLTAASVVIWFAPIHSADTYEQANARITRPGQKFNQLIVHIQATPLEQKMYETLKAKTNMQNTLLEMFAANRA